MFGVIGSDMRGWYGSGLNASRYKNILAPPPEPVVFIPTSINDCALWLDANDPDSLQINGDLSGANVNRVMKWFDKARPSNQNYYTHQGSPSHSGLYNTHTMNFLKTVYFEPNARMVNHLNNLVYNFQARTFFAVIKPLTDISGLLNPFLNIYNTLTPQGMNTGIAYNAVTGKWEWVMCENGISCGIGYELSDNPLNQRQIIMFAQTDQIDLSGNTAAHDTAYQPLLFSDPADAYYTGNSDYMLNNDTFGSAQDIAEIILYGRLLTHAEQIQVLEYLADKWNLSGPTSDSRPAPQQVSEGKEAEPEGKMESFYPTYGYAIYGQFDEGSPNWFWCDENQTVESPPVLIINYTGSTGDRDSQTYNILGSFYA